MPIHLIYGTDDDDFILGTNRRDLILAGSGDDRITTMGGNDTTFGETGNDTIFAYFGGDEVYGGAGDDNLVSSSFQTGGIGRLFGGAGNDQIFAGDLMSSSHGGAGDDTVTVYMRGDGSEAYGGAGIDTLQINLFDMPAEDRVVAIASGSDSGVTVGSNHLVATGFEAIDITTRDGDDYVRGGALADRIDLGSGGNVALGQGGDDFIAYHAGAENFLDGGGGEDSLLVVQWQGDTALTLTVTGTTGVDNHGSHLTNFEHWSFYGGTMGDEAQLGDAADFFFGRQGQDTGRGGGGDDLLSGGGGDDRLFGGGGADRLIGGAGVDTLRGGQDADGFSFVRLDWAADIILDFTSGEDRILVQSRALDHLLPRGVLDAARFHLDEASGAEGQFVLRTGAQPWENDLVWDANGTEAGGETLIATLAWGQAMVASDILIL